MRVLHICSGNLYGGVETIQVTLARHRDECPELEAHFTVCFEGRLSRELAACGVPIHRLGAVRVRNAISVWTARARLRRLLSTVRYDAAICHSPWTQSIFGPIVKAAGVPLLYWMHGAPSGRHWLERWAQRATPDRVICCSEFVSSLRWRLYPGVPGEVVYAPVSAAGKSTQGSAQAERLAVRRELETPEDAVVIIQVSRMEAWKGHKVHLEALGLLRDVPNWVCWIAGGAQRPAEITYLHELQKAAGKLGLLHKVKFLGERTEVERLLNAANLFCQPNSGAEPFGITFIEALAAGLPVVTSGIGGGREIVDESCGLLVPAGDAVSLAAALRRMVTDVDLRRQMSNAAPARARQLCDPSRQLQRLSDVIENAVATRGARAKATVGAVYDRAVTDRAYSSQQCREDLNHDC